MKAIKFYDIHLHTLDLSHINITAFLNRFHKEGTSNLVKSVLKIKTLWITLMSLLIVSLVAYFFFMAYFIIVLSALLFLVLINMVLLYFFPNSLISKAIYKFIKKRLNITNLVVRGNKARNLLSYMESHIKYDFLITEFFLKNKQPVIVSENNNFSMGGRVFNKIVLCPLVIDFGYESLHSENVFYNISPIKPVIVQTKDLLDAIRAYYNYEIILENRNGNKNFKVIPSNKSKEEKLFEIYPFMGINTKNYTLDQIEKMLNKYFGGFNGKDTAEERKTKLYEKIGTFESGFDDLQACKNIFTGIKLYSPLGFEPWPDEKIDKNGQNERKKVELLYETCESKNIPIITHCSTEGFLVDNQYREYSNPAEQWAEVLQKFPNLKISFAHFGLGNTKWKNTIAEYIKNDSKNVFADISCNTQKDNYYKELSKYIKKLDQQGLEDNIMFGTDFMINLLWLESYNEYLKDFFDTQHLPDKLKLKLVNKNVERFLFG